MPAPPRTSTAAIVAAAREILETDGLEAVTMHRVAERVGVRAPSLYKRLRDHAELMHRVANDVAVEFADELDAAAATSDPAADLAAIAAAFRAWAHRSPAAYALLTGPLPDGWRADDEMNQRTSAAILEVCRRLVGEDRALDAARTFVSFGHGFVSLELAGAFRLGGDPATAFAFGVSTLIRAMSADGADGRR